MLTTSWDIILWWEEQGIWFELEIAVKVGASCTNARLSRGNFLALVAGLSIAKVIPGVLLGGTQLIADKYVQGSSRALKLGRQVLINVN